MEKTMTCHEHPLYSVYRAMKGRCNNPHNNRWQYYGGRGITVCERWSQSFWVFVEDMGPRPTGYVIDRIDCDGNYEPNNCRWVTQKESIRNRRPFPNPNSLKTHCPQGHEYNEANTWVSKEGQRCCRACNRDRQRQRFGWTLSKETA